MEFDWVYLVVKVGVSLLWSGDMLVCLFNFVSKEEEYYYEIDCNDIYFMLIKVLVEEKWVVNLVMD